MYLEIYHYIDRLIAGYSMAEVHYSNGEVEFTQVLYVENKPKGRQQIGLEVEDRAIKNILPILLSDKIMELNKEFRRKDTADVNSDWELDINSLTKLYLRKLPSQNMFLPVLAQFTANSTTPVMVSLRMVKFYHELQDLFLTLTNKQLKWHQDRKIIST